MPAWLCGAPVAGLLVLLAGCEMLPVDHAPSSAAVTDASAGWATAGADETSVAGPYLMLMKVLAEAEPPAARKLREELEAAAGEEPVQAEDELRFALALSRPGNGLRRLRQARDLLKKLGAEDSALAPELRDLAAAMHVDVRHRLSLINTIVALRKDLDESKDAQTAGAQARQESFSRSESALRVLQDRNRDLERELAEANRKLDAVRQIENTVERTSRRAKPVPN